MCIPSNFDKNYLIPAGSTKKFGYLIHDLAAKYGPKLSVSNFHHLKKLSMKKQKARLDANFLKNHPSLHVYPK